MILSGVMPYPFNAGGNMFFALLIQIEGLLLRISEARITLINPFVAAMLSVCVEMNSCNAGIGNVAFGKAYFIAPRPASKTVFFDADLKPCKGLISFCSWAIISAFVLVIGKINGQMYYLITK